MANILIFAPLSLEQGRGGELSAIELASGLKKYHNISLIDTNRAFGRELLSVQFLNKELRGISRTRIKYLKFSFLNKHFGIPFPFDFLRLFKQVKSNDIVYYSLTGIGTNLMFILLSLLCLRTTFIVGHRMPLYSKKKLSFYNERMKISYILFSIFKSRFFHHTISFRRKKYLEKFINSENIFHIRHCINLDRFIDEKNENLQKNNIGFIYIGYLDKEDKGVDILIKAIIQILNEKKDQNIFFEFCGTGPLEEDIKNLEKRFPNFVKYNGYINYEEISKYYKRNDVLIFSSRREAFGRVIIEALASKLLIVCTKTIGSNEILSGKDFSFFINELTSQEIKNKILKIYNYWKQDPNQFETLKESARNYAIEKYSYSNELNGFLELFKKVKIYR